MMLKQRWIWLWQKLQPPNVPVEVFDELVSCYTSPDRFYHNLTHIKDCLHIFDVGKHLSVHPEEVELAIWFHDAIYNTSASDNEQKSAARARSVIVTAGLDEQIAERVGRLILATCHNERALDTDAQILVDVDLSILGREGGMFWQYERSIRDEYAWVPEGFFRRKRREILGGFLEREYIYNVGLYRDKFEDQARINIGQAIVRLGDALDVA